MAADVMKRDIFSGEPDGYTQEDGVLPLPIGERIAEMEFRGMSRDDASVAIHGGSEPAMDPVTAKRIREAKARAQVANVFKPAEA